MPAITPATARKIYIRGFIAATPESRIAALENLTAIHEALLDTKVPVVETNGKLDLGPGEQV